MTNAAIEKAKLDEQKAENARKGARERAEIDRKAWRDKKDVNLARWNTAFKGIDAATKAIGNTVGAAANVAKFANHPEWYTKGQETLVNQVVPDNFGYPVGAEFTQRYVSVLEPSNPLKNETSAYVKGIATLTYLNCLGIASSSSITDPANRAAIRIFSLIQEKTNYTKPYQASDLITLIAAEREILTGLAFCAKVLRLYNTTVNENLYFSREIIKGLGVNFEKLSKDYAMICARMGMLLQYTKDDLNIPKIPLMDRALQMSAAIYSDALESGVYSQLYTLRPGALGVLNDIAKPGEDKLTFTKFKFYGAPADYDLMGEILDTVERGIVNILHSDAFKFISGDLKRVFTEFYSPSDITWDGPAMVVHDEYTLDQIRNCASLDAYDIFGSPTIQWHLRDAVNLNGMVSSQFDSIIAPEKVYPDAVNVNFWADAKVTKDRVLDATRLCVICEPAQKDGVDISSCGSEVVIGIHITNFYDNAGSTVSQTVPYHNAIIMETDADRTYYSVSNLDVVRGLGNVTSFDNLPKPVIVIKRLDTVPVSIVETISTVPMERFNVLSREQFVNCNKVAINSELGLTSTFE